MSTETVFVPKLQVENVRLVFREVRKFEPKLVRDTQKQMRERLGGPLNTAASSILRSHLRYPDRPMTGWGSGGRVGWNTNRVVKGYKVSTAMQYDRSRHTWSVITFNQATPAGAVFDWAGRSTSGQGARGISFINNLQANIRFGSIKGSKHSRVVFPAVVKEYGTVINEFTDIIGDLEKKINSRVGG